MSRMFNLSIFIIWINSKVADLRLVSASLQHVLSHLAMSATRLKTVIFESNLFFYGASERFMDM